MTSITDIGPLKKTIPFRDGKTLEVGGVSALVLFDILSDNEAMKKLFLERELNADNVMQLIRTTPIMLGQVIACGLGHHGEEAFVDAAIRNLGAGEQLAILQAMLEVSFPQGLPAFLQNIQAMAGIDANSFAGLSGAEAATKSPQPSPDASETDTQQQTHGG